MATKRQQTLCISKISKSVLLASILFFCFQNALYAQCEELTKEYGKSYLPTIIYGNEMYGCVFSPNPHPKPFNDEYWRWDSCYHKNAEIYHYFDIHNFKDFYKLENGYLTFSKILGISKQQGKLGRIYDYDLTDCVNLNPEIDYTGYAACSLSGKKEGDYMLFYFEHSKLINVWKLSWNEFLDYLEWDKKEEGTMEHYLLIHNWLSWGN